MLNSSKEDILEEIWFGTTSESQDSSFNKNQKNNTKKQSNGKNNNCTTFSDLCQERLNQEFNGEETVNIFSFIEKIDQCYCINKLTNAKNFVNDSLISLNCLILR